MQHRFALITLLLLTLVGGTRVQAQFTFSMTWDSLNVPSPSVVNQNDTFRYDFTVNNLTNSTFSDSLIFKLRVAQNTFTLAAFDTLQIQPLGSRFFSLSDTAYALRYDGGVNVVVVWPTSPSQITTDSLIATLTVLSTNIEDAIVQGLPIDVFPIPSQQEIFFRMREGNVSIRNSEIRNLSGSVIFSCDGLPRMVSVVDFPAGIYFIHIEDELGRIAHLKMVKQ